MHLTHLILLPITLVFFGLGLFSPRPGKVCAFSICKLIEYPVHKLSFYESKACSRELSNPLRQARQCLRVADGEAPHGTAITPSYPVPRVQESCFANFEVRQARRYDPMSFRVRENLSAP